MSTTLFIKAKCSSTLLKQSIQLAQNLEEKLSVYKKDSLISKVNRSAFDQAIELDDETYKLIERALYISKETSSYFDITIGSLTQLTYKFGTTNEQIPNRNTLKKNTLKVDYKNIVLKDNTIRFLTKDTYIDLGGIAKGYTVDLIANFLKSKNVKKALISLGGEIATFGDSFNIGVTHPREQKNFTTFKVDKNTNISTSGDYERYINSPKYNHIINPEDGKSSSLYSSLTLKSKKQDVCTLDALNTAMFLMGPSDQEKIADKFELGFLLIDKQMKQSTYKF